MEYMEYIESIDLMLGSEISQSCGKYNYSTNFLH